MSVAFANSTDGKTCEGYDPTSTNDDVWVQLVLSLALGLSAFFGFCFLRPRWKGLYAARQRQTDEAASLPKLPDTFFGWIPVLYRITEEQVLDSAGLDAFVLLSFFKMSIKLFGVIFLITCAILVPINKKFAPFFPTPGNSTDPNIPKEPPPEFAFQLQHWLDDIDIEKAKGGYIHQTSYLWAYLVFTWLYSGLIIYFMRRETLRIIKVRQDYLGSQSTITDRTIRLSGVPPELRSDEKIKDFVEKLEIGKVESVTIVRNWKKLDDLMDQRMNILRKLEEAWTVHMGRQQTKTSKHHSVDDSSLVRVNENEDRDADENENLLGESHITAYEKPRPTTRLWYGFMNMQSKQVDAIDYFEGKLDRIDEKITLARKTEYQATPVAFVTMDSIPACQMAVQALLDPSPGQLQAKLSPAPSDVVWRNTYLPRTSRMIRSWIITIFILVLTVLWLIPVVALAGLLNVCTIRQVWPQLADVLEEHDILAALVQTALPTLIVSGLNVAVQYFYDYLANQQGMISQGDVELSVISKNFFFTFFNLFLVFTISGTASNFLPAFKDNLGKTFRDTATLAFLLATQIKQLGTFYTNFILLQSIGLFPFRLLEFGSVFFYPFMLIGSKTPRDYAELVQPPVFKYGFYLPTAILVFILCVAYSILPAGYMVLFFGLLYFVFGYYTYKYQLLYAMDHPQHATGGAWPIICYRIMLGMGVFQLLMAGVIALENQITAAILVVPLIPITIWYSYYFRRTYEPLTKFIALRSIRRDDSVDFNVIGEDVSHDQPADIRRRRSTTVDETREKGLKFVNPNLAKSLEKIWVDNKTENGSSGNFVATPPEVQHEESASGSTQSLGDTHIWRDDVDSNV